MAAMMAKDSDIAAMTGRDAGVAAIVTEDCRTDDLTIGKSLSALTKLNRWSQRPPFLLQNSATRAVKPSRDLTDDQTTEVYLLWRHCSSPSKTSGLISGAIIPASKINK